jgi:ELWxxDGT repeat protein
VLVRSFLVVAYLHSLGPRIVFVADDGTSGRELWASDGTPGGTVLLADVAPGPSNGIFEATGPDDLAVAGGRLYFPAGDATTGTELWSTDGTPGGTHMVADLQPGPESSAPRFFAPLPDGSVAFAAYSEGFGFELWRSDGTAAGTARVTDVSPGEASSDPWLPAVFGDWVVFLAFTGPTGSEAWAWRWNPDPEIFSDGFESGDTSAW